MTNLTVYADPVNYDRESGPHDIEGSILLTLAAQAADSVLELGCGTGRVTIPLAQRGFDITGLDVLPHMIDWARQKAEGLPITWVNDDVRHFRLDRQFGLIFTAGALIQHLLEPVDREAMLARVGEHLAPDGRFVVDAGFKRLEKMVDVDDPVFWYTFTDDQGREVTVSGTDHYDHDRQLWTQTLYRQRQEANERQHAEPVQLILRYFKPNELVSLLNDNGFEVLARYGDWTGTPLTGESKMQIYVCARSGC